MAEFLARHIELADSEGTHADVVLRPFIIEAPRLAGRASHDEFTARYCDHRGAIRAFGEFAPRLILRMRRAISHNDKQDGEDQSGDFQTAHWRKAPTILREPGPPPNEIFATSSVAGMTFQLVKFPKLLMAEFEVRPNGQHRCPPDLLFQRMQIVEIVTDLVRHGQWLSFFASEQ